jgi:anti-anti-sigma factor
MSLELETTRDRSGARTVKVRGRLDTHSYGEFDARMKPELEADERTLVLDLAGLDYISSAGIRSIFAARKQMAQRGGQLLVVNAQPQVRKVFEIVRAVPVSEIFSSVAELDAYLDAMQRKARAAEDDDGF